MRAGRISYQFPHDGPPASLSSVVRQRHVDHMKTIALAAIFGVVAEGILRALGSAYGKITFEGGDQNMLGVITFLWCLPGAIIGEHLLDLGGQAKLVFCFFLGSVQFFVLGLLIVAICRVWRRGNGV